MEVKLIRLQIAELAGNVPGDLDAIVRDYHAVSPGAEATLTLEGLRAMRYADLREFERLAHLLGYEHAVNPVHLAVSPPGYPVLSRIPPPPHTLTRQAPPPPRPPPPP